MKPPIALDVLIVGAGAVGLSLFCALRAQGCRVALVEQNVAPAPNDGRMLALSVAAQQWLATQSLWPADVASPIHSVAVAVPGASLPVLFEGAQPSPTALGYVLPLAALQQQLWEAARGPGFFPGWQLASVQSTGAFVYGQLASASTRAELTARLVVLADGGQSLLTLTGQAAARHAYGQSALVFTLVLQGAEAFRAYEWFTPEGVLALLPCGEHFAGVWVLAQASAERLLALSAADFLAELQGLLGGSLAAQHLLSSVQRFEPKLQLAPRRPLPRVVTLGNAAQTLHPVGGQGLNLGLRDVEVLARELLGEPDPGASAVLARYQRLRRSDQALTVGITHGLAHAFAHRLDGLSALQRRALAAVPEAFKQALLRTLIYGWRT